jgi:5-bromo-4-chloroindolyl phosphate hydrolysis protein
MPQPNTINIVVVFNSAGATTNINQLNQQILSIGTVAQTTSNQVNNAFNGIGTGLGQMTSMLQAFGISLSAAGLARFVRELIDMGDEMYRLRIAMSQTAGGAQAFEDLYDVSRRVHFEWRELVKNANDLRLAGMSMQDATRTVEALAAATRSAGKSQEDLNKSISVMANLQAKGFATGRELFTGLKQSGIVPREILEQATGIKDINTLREDLRDFNIDALLPLIAHYALLKAQQDKLHESSQSLDAAYADLKTTLNEVGIALSKAFSPTVVEALRRLNETLEFTLVLIKTIKTTAADFTPDWVTALWKEWQKLQLIMESILSLSTLLMRRRLGEDVTPKPAAQPLTPDQVKELQNNLFRPDLKAIKAANDIAANLLDEAQKRYALAGKESIAALTYSYEIHYRKIVEAAKSASAARAALEIAHLAFAKDVATEVLKHHEEVNKEIEKSVHNMDETRRKIATAQQTMEPDDTFAGRARAERIASAEEEVKIRHQMAIRTADEDRRTRLQVEEAWRVGQFQQAVKYEQDNARLHTQLNAEADQAVAANRIQMEKKTLALVREYEKQQREADLQDLISAYQRAAELREAIIGTARPLTPQGQIAQIEAISEGRIRVIKNEQQARENALREELRIYNELHPYSDSGTDEKRQETARELSRLSNDANQKIKLDRINAWRDANEIILREQMRLYDSIKSMVEKIWDAALDKSKSFWESLGNIIKSTILNALKEIVTSRIAATFASLIGGGTYQFRTDAMGITRPPQASGLPNPFRILTQDVTGSAVSYSSPSQGSAQRIVSDDLTNLARQAQAESATVSSQGSADRSMSDTGGGYSSLGGYSPLGGGDEIIREQARRNTPGSSTTASGQSQIQRSVQDLRTKFNIGKDITLSNGTTVPWASASAGAKLGSVLKSPGMGALAATVGLPIALQGLKQKGVLGGIMAVGGGALAGAGVAQMLGQNPIAGAMAGGGLGLMGAGWEKGGAIGLGMDVLGGAAAGAGIGAMIGTMILPGIGTAAGAVVGAAVGAVTGAAEGIVRLFVKSQDEKIRAGIKQIYGIDIPSQSIRKQIAEIINQKYGGNVNLGLYSQDVQDIVRLYSLSTGQQAGLPRPMYSASMAQSAGGLQVQPVYSGGQLVQSPYSGATTTQYAQAALYMQLNPSLAMQLFSGQVVNVMQQNPGTVAQANAAGVGSGNSRDAQRTALLEPLTVMS